MIKIKDKSNRNKSFTEAMYSYRFSVKQLKLLLHVNCDAFSFLVHLSRRFKCTIGITRCPSVVNSSHFRLLLWNRWTEFAETWQEVRTQTLFFSGRSKKHNGCPGLWLAEIFSISSLIFTYWGNLTGSKNSTSSTIYQVCVFRTDRKNKMATPTSDWPRHFRLLLWNRWTEFAETWQEARTQSPLPGRCFRADLKNKMASRPLIGRDIFNVFSEIAEWNLSKLDKKQELNVLYQVRVFRLIGKTRLPPWPLIGWDILDYFPEFAGTWQEAITQCPLPISSFCVDWKTKITALENSSRKVANWTQVHDMWPFGPLVMKYMYIYINICAKLRFLWPWIRLISLFRFICGMFILKIIYLNV